MPWKSLVVRFDPLGHIKRSPVFFLFFFNCSSRFQFHKHQNSACKKKATNKSWEKKRNSSFSARLIVFRGVLWSFRELCIEMGCSFEATEGLGLVDLGLAPSWSPLLSPRLVAVTVESGRVHATNQFERPPPRSVNNAFPKHVHLNSSCRPPWTLSTSLTFFFCFFRSRRSLLADFSLDTLQSGVDVDKDDDKQVEERTNNSQHGQYGLLLLLLGLQCPHVLKGDNGGGHDPILTRTNVT